MKRIRGFVWCCIPIVCGVSAAAERAIALKEGPGAQQVIASCNSCHSLDYIPMNSPFLDRAGWEAEVTKMVKAYGAPISSEDAKAIGDYLATHYAKP